MNSNTKKFNDNNYTNLARDGVFFFAMTIINLNNFRQKYEYQTFTFSD